MCMSKFQTLSLHICYIIITTYYYISNSLTQEKKKKEKKSEVQDAMELIQIQWDVFTTKQTMQYI